MYRVRARGWVQWQSAAGPWRGWAACHVLAAPEIDGVLPREISTCPHLDTFVKNITPSLEGGNTALVLDVEPIFGVQVAARLSALRCAHVVLVLPRWPYREAILPVDRLLWILLEEAVALQVDQTSTNVVFVLDAERGKRVVRKARDGRADNRYALSPGDLPNLASLRERGIRRVVKITRA